MHPIEFKIIAFMQKLATQSVAVDDKLLEPTMASIKHFLRKMYEENPNKEFTLRLSSIGRPLCQQQMSKKKAPALQDEWNNPLRMFFGGVIEATAVCILRAAGVNVQEEQTRVILKLKNNIDISGTLDLVIDGRVWDVKSASPYNFTHKFESYAFLKQHDDFGYVPQLYGYAEARGLPVGGWIIVDKSSGVIKILEVPEDEIEKDTKHYIKLISDNASKLMGNEEFKRCFQAIDEKFKKKFTGNQYIDSPCSFCSFRYNCWPTLQYLPNQLSEAFDRPYRHYVKIGMKDLKNVNCTKSKGQRAKVTAKDSAVDITNILYSG